MTGVSKIKQLIARICTNTYLLLNDTYKLRCPRCKYKMRKLTRGDIVLDTCNNCGGLFLDDGEIEKLVNYNKQSTKKTSKGKQNEKTK